jgi:hypothetical protein
MKKAWLVVPFVMVGLTGCAAMLTNQARAKMRADCEAKGLQFVETSAKSTELIVAEQAEVSGMCVGPGDPRYINPSQH